MKFVPLTMESPVEAGRGVEVKVNPANVRYVRPNTDPERRLIHTFVYMVGSGEPLEIYEAMSVVISRLEEES